jgi:hypothetical protein
MGVKFSRPALNPNSRNRPSRMRPRQGSENRPHGCRKIIGPRLPSLRRSRCSRVTIELNHRLDKMIRLVDLRGVNFGYLHPGGSPVVPVRSFSHDPRSQGLNVGMSAKDIGGDALNIWNGRERQLVFLRFAST